MKRMKVSFILSLNYSLNREIFDWSWIIKSTRKINWIIAKSICIGAKAARKKIRGYSQALRKAGWRT